VTEVPDEHVELDEEEDDDDDELLVSSSCSSLSSSVRFSRSSSSVFTSSTTSSVKLVLILLMLSMTQLSSENNECVQPLLVSLSDWSMMSSIRFSMSSSRSSRLLMIGPISSVSSSIHPTMIGKIELKEVSILLLLELACVPVGAMVVVGERVIGVDTSPPLITGMTMVEPLVVWVTLMMAGGLVTAPGMAEVVVVFALFDALMLGIPPPDEDELEMDPETLLLEDDEELDPLVELPVPRRLVELPADTEVELADVDEDEALVVMPVPGRIVVEFTPAIEVELDSVVDVDELEMLPVPRGTVVALVVGICNELDDEVDEEIVDEEEMSVTTVVLPATREVELEELDEAEVTAVVELL
jgi:hypothetical protein